MYSGCRISLKPTIYNSPPTPSTTTYQITNNKNAQYEPDNNT